MKYNPREIAENVNVSPRSPVKEFFVLLAGCLGILLLVYITLGFCVDVTARYIPHTIEQKLGVFFEQAYAVEVHNEQSQRLQDIFDGLVATLHKKDLTYQKEKSFFSDR